MQEVAMNRATKFYKLLVVFLCYEGKEFRNRRRTMRFYRVLGLKIILFTFIQKHMDKNISRGKGNFSF